MKLIIDIPENNYNQIREGFYEDNCGVMAISIIDGTPIPDKATNEDVFKAVFSDSTNEDDYKWLSRDWRSWWNALYQKGGKE